ncbi:polysaccharide deacetylase family protein [Enterovibrio norvegicus]|uniref:polysaccharide deacetylase family protein n=1 Tax=Enterovibrio norvegicus TaxID=188144 RepID=UPI000C819350|nr:polysaccharide deacetylase family protein [Enterovibrio norvegicus]PMN71092.1 hypothetical protein BCT27_17385 [Enterovibrio norvegicus]
MITIHVPFISNKFTYAVNYVFQERLGIEYDIKIRYNSGEELSIIIEYNGEEVSFPLFFWDSESGDLKVDKILSLDKVDILLKGKKVPVINSSNRRVNGVTDVDVFGFIFFMLSRIEELNESKQLDDHQRFPAKESFAFKHGFLEFPVVDWYVELVAEELKLIGVNKKNKDNFTTVVSCDVDYPTEYYFQSYKSFFRKFITSLVKERKFSRSIGLIKRFIFSSLNINQNDIFTENVRYIMDVNERNDRKVIFYFIPYNTSKLDSNLSIESKLVTKLVEEIRDRGHLIGIHPSYDSTTDKAIFELNVNKFRDSAAYFEGEELHSRTHFLKWDAFNTPAWLESSNINVDSSLGYADLSGFRCGTCHPFKLYDLKNDKSTNISEFPLVCMDASILSTKYEGLNNFNRALERVSFLKEQCKQVNGVFTLLWHNSSFEEKFEKKLYENVTKVE